MSRLTNRFLAAKRKLARVEKLRAEAAERMDTRPIANGLEWAKQALKDELVELAAAMTRRGWQSLPPEVRPPEFRR